jgi:hypothetical protein
MHNVQIFGEPFFDINSLQAKDLGWKLRYADYAAYSSLGTVRATEVAETI